MISLKELTNKAISNMELVGITDANTDAWLLLEFCLGITRQQYLMNINACISNEEAEKYLELVEMRMQRIPLQHITGHQEFMGLDFLVNKDVLIPRQDTELLVEKTIEAINKIRKQKDFVRVLDMCTGSGCIAISIAKLCDNVCVTGVDISKDSLEVARKNAAINEVNVTFIESDLFQNVNEKFDVIVSNPPYIPVDVIQSLEPEVRDHEPIRALEGRDDGLHFYKKITEKIPSFLEEDGVILYEIGHDQGESVSSLLRKIKSCVKVYKDLAGLDRVVIGKDE